LPIALAMDQVVCGQMFRVPKLSCFVLLFLIIIMLINNVIIIIIIFY